MIVMLMERIRTILRMMILITTYFLPTGAFP